MRLAHIATASLLFVSPLLAHAQDAATRDDRLQVFFLIYAFGFAVTLLLLVAIARKKPQKDSPARIMMQKKVPHDE